MMGMRNDAPDFGLERLLLHGTIEEIMEYRRIAKANTA
jgi:hypothetical protein